MAVRSYRDLGAWQKAMDTIELVYRASERFPKSEMYGLTSQIRPIEYCRRSGTKEHQ